MTGLAAESFCEQCGAFFSGNTKYHLMKHSDRSYEDQFTFDEEVSARYEQNYVIHNGALP